jgi:hypothetical protein
MFVLAPATRFGYFVYPVGLFAWLEVSRMGQAAPAAPADPAAAPAEPAGPPAPPGPGVARPANSARQEAYQ